MYFALFVASHLRTAKPVTVMAFTFAAFCYIVALILSAFLIFFVIYHVSVFLSAKELVHRLNELLVNKATI